MLTEWIKNIIFVVLFASFLELLLPNSSMQRFVRVIMGLFIMLAILNPIIDAVQHFASVSQVPALSTNLGNPDLVANEVDHAGKERDKLSSTLYKKELSQQIKILIMAIDGVADANVAIEIHDSNNKIKGIESILIYVKPGISSRNGKKINIEEIRIEKEANKDEEIHTNLKKRITDMLVELYQIPKEKIEIKMVYS